MVDAVPVSKILQLTVTACLAEWAEMVSFSKNHVENQFPRLDHPVRVRLYFHTFGYRENTGGLQSPLSLDLYNANPTGTGRGQRSVVAKCGNVYPRLFRCR
jgi:hypothetical protein